MSNEYKDWHWYMAQEVALNNGIVKIEFCDTYQNGYLIIGINSDSIRCAYYIYLDEDYGWCYHELNP